MRLFLVALAAIAAAGCAENASSGPLSVGDRAPPYGARSLEGDSVDLGTLSQRVVLLNVWATWCAPCRDEMPELQELQERYADELMVLGVNIDRSGAEADVRRFLGEVGVDFSTLLDPQERVVRRFRTMGVPETFLIDRAGVIRARWIGRYRPMSPDNLAFGEGAMSH